MRKAAGIIMLVFGVFIIVGGLPMVLQSGLGAAERVWLWVLLALSILILAAGISVLRRRAYWWALLAAIAMVLVGVTHAVRAWQDPIWRYHFDTATRLLRAAGSLALWGIPGLLALVFLVKRRNEFTGTEANEAVTGDE